MTFLEFIIRFAITAMESVLSNRLFAILTDVFVSLALLASVVITAQQNSISQVLKINP